MGVFKKLFDNGWTPNNMTRTQNFFKGKVIGQVIDPFDLINAKQMFPEVLKDIKLGSKLISDNQKGPVHTFADMEGMVIFSEQ